MAVTQKNREMEIITPLGKDILLLQDMSVTEELGRLFTINADVRSTDNINFEELLGQKVSIRVNLTEGERFFNGYVSSLSQGVDDGHYAKYNLTIQPWFWFLTRTSDCKIFQGMTVPDIIKDVCNGLGFTDIDAKLTTSYRTWGYCVQYRETDFNFLSRLMEQEGIYYYFTHEKDKHILNLADGYGSHDPIPDYEMLEYYPPDDVVVRDDKRVDGWFVSKKIQPGAYVLTDYDFVKPKADLKVNSTITRKHSEAEYEIFDYPGEYIKTDDGGDHYVQARIEELHTQYEKIQGTGVAKGLTSGGLFKLSNYPRDDQNREYLVVSVTHNMHMDDFEAGGGGGGASYTNSFTVVDSSTAYRTARITPKPMVQGPQTAVVVGKSGEEIDTDKHGRVKLQFHWDRYGKFDENSSCWVRVSQLWAGKTWGGIHIPRIGQEVIVEFLEGDPDRPIVTGRVYNGDQTPPYDLPTNKTQSGIKSRSSKGGSGANFNEIRFEDKKGNEQVYIHAEKNQDNIVENNETTSVGNDRTEHIGNDERVTVKHNRYISIENDEDIQVVQDSYETVCRNKNIKINGKHTEVIEGDTDIMVTKGRYVRKIKTKDSYFEVKGFVREVFKNSKHTEIADNLTEDVGKKIDIKAGDKITLDAKEILIKAGEKITIQVGGSKVLLTSSGIIINSSGDVKIHGSQVKVNT